MAASSDSSLALSRPRSATLTPSESLPSRSTLLAVRPMIQVRVRLRPVLPFLESDASLDEAAIRKNLEKLSLQATDGL